MNSHQRLGKINIINSLTLLLSSPTFGHVLFPNAVDPSPKAIPHQGAVKVTRRMGETFFT